MAIRWDPLLARALAAELDSALDGARLRALRLDARTRDAILLFRDRSLIWRLHPERGWLELREPVEPEPTDLRLRARLRGVRAPPDERMILFELSGERSDAGRYQMVIELLGNRMNAIVTEGPDGIARHVLRTREGARQGHVWQPPTPTGRIGIDGALEEVEWLRLLAPVPPPERRKELMRTIAWVSPLNVSAFLGDDVDADGPDGPEAPLRVGWGRWREAVAGSAADGPGAPALLETDRGPQPYPFVPAGSRGRPTESLLDAFDACARSEREQGVAPAALSVGPALLERLERAVAQADRRIVRLEAELRDREDPEALRAIGDLLLARYGEVPEGASSVELTDFEGATVEVTLDPSLAPNENASAYYDRAARSERAAERLPKLLREAGGERDRLHALLDAARSGEVDAGAVRAAVPELPSTQTRGEEAPPLPYRSFRSSGGLEIRVGRGARQNDDLTFHHSSPDDVWLHARHTAGAHVILRWPGPGNPPARDLQEAGVLAALHSKARTSGSVPVDWTLRKYVRKPRRSPPGAVVPDRVSTVFVTPDEALLERLAES